MVVRRLPFISGVVKKTTPSGDQPIFEKISLIKQIIPFFSLELAHAGRLSTNGAKNRVARPGMRRQVR